MKKKLFALLLLLALTLSGCRLEAPAPSPVSGDGLTVHYIDVGQADSILLECGGEFMLIDGGNREDSDLVVTYLEQQGVRELKALVCTHAHEDHVGGLPAVLAVYPTAGVYAPTRTYSSNIFDKFVYYTDQQGLEITIPSPGDQLTLGEASLTVLGPVKSYAETNDTSIVLRAVYGDTAFLFTGDAETQSETDILDSGASVRADVLKVGHHGSNSSTGYRFLYEVDPEYAVISVGTGNTYGHPHDEPLSRLNQAGVTVLRTDRLGTIVARSDGREVSFTWDDQSANPDNAEPAAPTVYIGNKNSKVFHAPDCASLPAEKNQVTFGTYEEAVEAGYKPCGGCLG
ncbi:MAG: MBL fold metallo-hydrolase [Eubacteriales bacterium]|nr:MBL fold metallo-hydrolase [Eubacteriales bacterium]